MGDKLTFEGLISGKSFNKEGKILKEYNRKKEGMIDVEDIEENKVCIDAMMMTHAILNSDFKEILIQNIRGDSPYTTEICKKETIGNIKYELKISWEEAKEKFENFKKEILLKFLEFKQDYMQEGRKLFDKVISSGFRIKNKRTFLKDCVNIITISKNKVSDFFCNDEELGKVCRKFNIKINFITIADSSEKLIKEHFKFYPKKKYQKKGRRVK